MADLKSPALAVAVILLSYFGCVLSYRKGAEDAKREIVIALRERGLLSPEFHPEIK